MLLISTLMLHSALAVKEVKLQLSEINPQTKIIVGGAPFSMDKKLWQAVGADRMGENSFDALMYINEIQEGKL